MAYRFSGAAGVVSSFGIGKLLAVFISGRLSDKFGRKLSVILGVFFYIVFLGGILLSPNTIIAYMFGISAGIANSFLDTGTYPALMEAYPKKPLLPISLLKHLYNLVNSFYRL